MTEQNLSKCRCGFDRTSKFIDTQYEYSFWGWFALFTGISARPTKALLKCTKCHTVIETISDPDALKKYIGR